MANGNFRGRGPHQPELQEEVIRNPPARFSPPAGGAGGSQNGQGSAGSGAVLSLYIALVAGALLNGAVVFFTGGYGNGLRTSFSLIGTVVFVVFLFIVALHFSTAVNYLNWAAVFWYSRPGKGRAQLLDSVFYIGEALALLVMSFTLSTAGTVPTAFFYVFAAYAALYAVWDVFTMIFDYFSIARLLNFVESAAVAAIIAGVIRFGVPQYVAVSSAVAVGSTLLDFALTVVALRARFVGAPAT